MQKISRFSNIKNELEKQNYLNNINQKSKKQQAVFQNPFFKQIDEQEDHQLIIESRIQQLEDADVKVSKDLNLYLQHKVKSHIIDHKLKNNYDYVRLKYTIRIWKEQSIKVKIAEEQQKQQQFKQEKENMIDDMIKNKKYEKLKKEQEKERLDELDDEKSQILELQELVKTKKLQNKGENYELLQNQQENFEEKDELYKMPEQDLLQYIPYCTDIYLGKD